MSEIKVAVTGAAGQVGSALVKRMLEITNIETIAICRNSISAGIVDFLAPGCKIRIGSITEKDAANKLLGDSNVIINCALAMVKGRPRESRLLNKAIIDGFSHLKRLKSLIHLSSISVYGGSIISDKYLRSTFENPRADNDYGRSKLYIERYARRMCMSKKLTCYILRVGHVIGPNVDRSRQLIEAARNPHFRLPFNGELPSNTIQVDRLTALITGLLIGSIPSGTYNVADKEKTWREVFDLHTQAIGLPPVRGMSPHKSNCIRSLYSSRSIWHDFIKWLKSLSILNLITYPAIFDLAFRFMAVIPPMITNRLATSYKCRDVKRQIATVNRSGNQIISPYYFSDAMPGPYLTFPPDTEFNCASEDEISRQLRTWDNQFSQSNWLPHSIRRYLDYDNFHLLYRDHAML
jgi:nucleoside-diphosphate-sugar epimerase